MTYEAIVELLDFLTPPGADDLEIAVRLTEIRAVSMAG